MPINIIIIEQPFYTQAFAVAAFVAAELDADANADSTTPWVTATVALAGVARD